MIEYPKKTVLDAEFYDYHLKDRMPSKIFDVHVHLNLPEHIPHITEERIHSDWAFECGLYLTMEEALQRAKMLFPGIDYSLAGFPWPIREANLEKNNAYLIKKNEEGTAFPFMGVRPEWDPDYLEEQLPHFCGFKPYPDFVAHYKGAENSIFDFLPHSHLSVLDRHKKAVVLHLPRKDRLADANNVRELLEIRQKYPDITIIIAHLGRSFCPIYLEKGLSQMGADVDGFYFDTAAVINPAVYRLAFDRLDCQKILYGTDAPLMYWHGKRRWTETTYENLCREDYSWNRHAEGVEMEQSYTFILYEQLKNILDTMDSFGFSMDEKIGFFGENAKCILII